MIGAKKKEKGKEAMLGVKEKKMREQELEVERRELLNMRATTNPFAPSSLGAA